MLIGLDHIIIGVNNLEQAARVFTEKLGLTVSGGGNHPEGGTANRIIVIGDTYLELIAVRDPVEAQKSMLDRLAQGEGYLNFVLASNDIQKVSEEIVARGVEIKGPRKGELQSAQGRSRSWIRTDIERDDLTQHYPFIIQHDSSGEERRMRLAGWQMPPAHALKATKVLSATLVVDDLPEASQRFERIYGVHPSEEFSGENDSWDAILVSFFLSESQQSFELATPLPALLDPVDDAQFLPEPGALRSYLQRYGESLCRITLSVESLDHARDFLDRQQVLYTYREEPRPVLWIHPDYACGAAIVLHEFTPELPPSNPLIME